MNQTPNYQLSQWEAADKVQRTDFNADNAKIDAALKAETDARTALAARVAKCGNCKIYTTTYTGTGTNGHDHPTVIHFPQKPIFALVIYYNTFVFLPPEDVSYRMDNKNLGQLIWSGSTASLYHDDSAGQSGPGWQLNDSQTTYRVVGFIAADQ